MAAPLQPGTWVQVKNSGNGIVQRQQGAAYYVRLVTGPEILAPSYLIVPLHITPPAPVPGATSTTGAEPRLPAFRPPTLTPVRPPEDGARRALEALRFGVVPDSALQDLTLGYDEWEEWVQGRLPDVHADEPTVSEIVGPYGTGKSHAMALIRQVARAQGYVTARVEVDGRSVTLADPAKFLYALWRSLCLPMGDPVDLIDLYVYAQLRSAFPPQVVPKGKDRVLRNYQIVQALRGNGRFDVCRHAVNSVLSSSDEFNASEVKDQLRREGWLLPDQCQIYPMVGRSVEDRPYDFLESLIGHAQIAQKAGFQGLVVTVDEFEVESAVLDAERRSREKAVLDVLKLYLQRESSHPSVPLALFFATAAEGSRGEDIVDELIDTCDGEYRVLQSWGASDFRALAVRIFELYGRAYGFNSKLEPACVDRALENPTGNDRIRQFIRRFLFVLDATYGPPSAVVA